MAYSQAIELSNDEIVFLQPITRNRTVQAQVVDRAKHFFTNHRTCQIKV